jgi:uncharacterized protein HemX
MPAAVPIAAAVIAAGATVYSVQQQKKMQEKSAQDQYNLEKQREEAQKNMPKLPDTAALGASIAQGQQRAQSAGGTISSDPTKNKQAGQLGSPINTGQKALLGT